MRQKPRFGYYLTHWDLLDILGCLERHWRINLAPLILRTCDTRRILASNHEYAVIGHSRATVGRFLGVGAGLASSATALVIASAITYAERWGFLQARAFWTLPLTATVFYTLGHLAFDRWAWRTWLVHLFLNVPDLRGKWHCDGESIDPVTGKVEYKWVAEVTVSQSWEKIRIYSETKQSRSRSVAASILVEEDVGYILMYSYRNHPRPGEPELKAHHGYAEWHISKDGLTAEATYFNGDGRYTGGRMKLSRKARDN